MISQIGRFALNIWSYIYAYLMCAFIVSATPPALFIWALWRIGTFLLPQWIYQRGDDIFYVIHNRWMLMFYELVIGTEICFYGDGDKLMEKRESILYIGNHRSSMDWLIATMIANRQGSLAGIRFITKDVFRALPFYGFISLQHGSIFVDRQRFNKKDMVKGLKYLQNPDFLKWVVIYPEGTRFNMRFTKTLEKSRNFAENCGLPVLRHHLSPRSKGVYIILSQLRHHLDAVYDFTIIVESKGKRIGPNDIIPSMIGFLRMKKPRLHVYVSRYSMGDVPQDEKKLALWLHGIFLKKDQLVSSFLSRRLDGHSPWGEGKVTRLNVVDTIPCLVIYLMFCTVLVGTAFGRIVYWKLLVSSILSTYAWVGAHYLYLQLLYK